MRGKTTTPEDIYRIMASWAVTNNVNETAKRLDMAESTVRKIVKENKDKEEFTKLCDEKKAEFSQKASEIIKKGMTLLERRFNRAIEHETELDILIDEIFATNKTEISQDEKTKLVTKIRALQLQDIKAITVAVATMYDKKALADGKPTERIDVIGDDKLQKLAELAGYERKQQ